VHDTCRLFRTGGRRDSSKASPELNNKYARFCLDPFRSSTGHMSRKHYRTARPRHDAYSHARNRAQPFMWNLVSDRSTTKLQVVRRIPPINLYQLQSSSHKAYHAIYQRHTSPRAEHSHQIKHPQDVAGARADPAADPEPTKTDPAPLGPDDCLEAAI
jgi:hypothetical protein